MHDPIDPVINLVCLLGPGRPADCKSVHLSIDSSTVGSLILQNPFLQIALKLLNALLFNFADVII